MIINDDKKITTILGRIGAEKEPDADDLGESIQDLHVAAEDIIQALHSKNAMALSEALTAYLEIFESHKELGG